MNLNPYLLIEKLFLQNKNNDLVSILIIFFKEFKIRETKELRKAYDSLNPHD